MLNETRRGSTVGGNATGAQRRKYLMTPGAKGEGVHNETRRGSLGSEGGSEVQ